MSNYVAAGNLSMWRRKFESKFWPFGPEFRFKFPRQKVDMYRRFAPKITVRIQFYVWGVYFDTPRTLNCAHVDLYVRGVSKVTHPKPYIRCVSNSMFRCVFWHTPNLNLNMCLNISLGCAKTDTPQTITWMRTLIYVWVVLKLGAQST